MAHSKVAEELSRELREEEARMSADERIALAFKLGDDDLAIFASANGLSLEEAARRLRIQSQLSRPRPSRAVLSLDESPAGSKLS